MKTEKRKPDSRHIAVLRKELGQRLCWVRHYSAGRPAESRAWLERARASAKGLVTLGREWEARGMWEFYRPGKEFLT